MVLSEEMARFPPLVLSTSIVPSIVMVLSTVMGRSIHMELVSRVGSFGAHGSLAFHDSLRHDGTLLLPGSLSVCGSLVVSVLAHGLWCYRTLKMSGAIV